MCSMKRCALNEITVKVLNFGTPEVFAVIYSKIQTKRLNPRVFCQNEANGIANSEDPDQTGSSLIWACTVCPDLSVLKLRFITVGPDNAWVILLLDPGSICGGLDVNSPSVKNSFLWFSAGAQYLIQVKIQSFKIVYLKYGLIVLFNCNQKGHKESLHKIIVGFFILYKAVLWLGQPWMISLFKKCPRYSNV